MRERNDAMTLPGGHGDGYRVDLGDDGQTSPQCMWHAPGPSGCPQLPQGAGRSLRLAGDALAALKADSFLCRSELLHWGHCGAGEDWRTSFSNSCPQAAHAYSKMGMVSILPMMPKPWLSPALPRTGAEFTCYQFLPCPSVAPGPPGTVGGRRRAVRPGHAGPADSH
ncbi:MAG: hypothetical protein AW07_01695 [Candidatus Accumulibacter sp. SK-11]|nr:MAG: hypothetical protein AW07_01695 [Candidatus Accumulibacter sp. SK-11]